MIRNSSKTQRWMNERWGAAKHDVSRKWIPRPENFFITRQTFICLRQSSRLITKSFPIEILSDPTIDEWVSKRKVLMSWNVYWIIVISDLLLMSSTFNRRSVLLFEMKTIPQQIVTINKTTDGISAWLATEMKPKGYSLRKKLDLLFV